MVKASLCMDPNYPRQTFSGEGRELGTFEAGEKSLS